MSVSIVTILIGVFLLGFALYRLWVLVSLLRKKSASETWPGVTAEVVSSKVIERRSGKSGRSYHPEIGYKYKVIGQEFEDNVSLRGLFPSRQNADIAIQKVGSTIEVRYDPNDPRVHISAEERINFWDVALIVLTLLGALFILVTPLIIN